MSSRRQTAQRSRCVRQREQRCYLLAVSAMPPSWLIAQANWGTFNVCPAGERWPDDSMRPAIEDLLGAGAILRHLPGQNSVEALVAVEVFESVVPRLTEVIAQSCSGREVVERGFASDVEFAVALDVSQRVPRYDGVAFINDQQLAA